MDPKADVYPSLAEGRVGVGSGGLYLNKCEQYVWVRFQVWPEEKKKGDKAIKPMLVLATNITHLCLKVR